MATEILKKQTIVGTDAQYEANRSTYGEGTVFESTSLLGESDIDPTYTNKFVERKVSESGLYAYCFDTTGITKTRYISEGFPAYSLVERDEKGRVRTADPEGQNDAVTKSYADNRFRYTHFIEVEFNPAPEPYVSYVLIGTIIYTSNSATPITSIDQLPLNVALPIHGMMYTDAENKIYTATRKTKSTGTSYLDITYLYYSDNTGVTKATQSDIIPTKVTDTVL